MGTRLELQTELESVIGKRLDNKQNVYFQPPESVKMVYPCIVYNLDSIDQSHADNIVYRNTKGYQITLIEKDPDSIFLDKILKSFKQIRFERSFVSSNLYHRVFRLYY